MDPSTKHFPVSECVKKELSGPNHADLFSIAEAKKGLFLIRCRNLGPPKCPLNGCPVFSKIVFFND